MALVVAALLAGCQTSDYSGSITGFSTATNALATSDSAIAQAAVAARTKQLEAYASDHPDAQVVFNSQKCGGNSGYKAGDCSISIGGMAVLTGVDPATGSLVKYASALAAIINDKSTATLSTDVGNLGSAVQGLATTLNATGAATDIGPAATIVGKLGALAVNARQLQILRQATTAADPLVQKLVPMIADRDEQLTRIAIDQQVTDLGAMRTSFNHDPKRSVSDLAKMAQMAAAIDQAQTADTKAAVMKLAALHHKLTLNLTKPTISWGEIQSDGGALVQDLQTMATAEHSLAAANATRPPSSIN